MRGAEIVAPYGFRAPGRRKRQPYFRFTGIQIAL